MKKKQREVLEKLSKEELIKIIEFLFSTSLKLCDEFDKYKSKIKQKEIDEEGLYDYAKGM